MFEFETKDEKICEEIDFGKNQLTFSFYYESLNPSNKLFFHSFFFLNHLKYFNANLRLFKQYRINQNCNLYALHTKRGSDRSENGSNNTSNEI